MAIAIAVKYYNQNELNSEVNDHRFRITNRAQLYT